MDQLVMARAGRMLARDTQHMRCMRRRRVSPAQTQAKSRRALSARSLQAGARRRDSPADGNSRTRVVRGRRHRDHPGASLPQAFGALLWHLTGC